MQVHTTTKSGKGAQATEDVYREHFDLLHYIACHKFKIPDGDADNLIQEVFLAYLSTVNEVRDVRPWLVGATCNASRHYWRVRGRSEPLPEDILEQGDPGSHGLAETFAMRLTIRQTLNRLHEKCRETLRLRYFEGCSAAEVAKELDTTNRYAEKLIHNCLKRAHEIYLILTEVKK